MEYDTPVRSKVFLEKEITSQSDSCPSATLDVEENTKNRNWTIDKFAYGPLNPDYPDILPIDSESSIKAISALFSITSLCLLTTGITPRAHVSLVTGGGSNGSFQSLSSPGSYLI